MFEQFLSDFLRLQTALSSSRENEDKYQASHPNLRKLDTGGKCWNKNLSITVSSHHLPALTISYFIVLGFGATASIDDGSSQQNGYPKNRYLKEAHHTLDKNLGREMLHLFSYIPRFYIKFVCCN